MASSSSSKTTTSSAAGWAYPSRIAILPLLLLVVLLQWTLIFYLLFREHHLAGAPPHELPLESSSSQSLPAASRFLCPTGNSIETSSLSSSAAAGASSETSSLEGVAVTLMLRAPQWFHLRYTAMISNALMNLPNTTTWKVQVFYHPQWFVDTVLPWHPGLARWYQQASLDPDFPILFTPLADQVLQPAPEQKRRGKVKPKMILSSRWFWEHVAAERVIMFSGNGAFCGNRVTRATSLSAGGGGSDLGWSELFKQVDFVGQPWNSHGGYGGDASSHSFRRRSVMLQAIDYATQYKMELGNSAEHGWIMQVLWAMHQDEAAKSSLRLATPLQTHVFGGVVNLTNDQGVLKHVPLIVAGTQAHLTYDQRDSLLKHCPELKVIFPSLHEPACFGAHPNGPKCKASICALQDEIPSSGC